MNPKTERRKNKNGELQAMTQAQKNKLERSDKIFNMMSAFLRRRLV